VQFRLSWGCTSCLELALNGKLDIETRENLSKSHVASKVCTVSVSFFAQGGADSANFQSLLFTINDLLVRCIWHEFQLL
jgi:hypothetical protein